MWGRGQRGNNATHLALGQFSITSPSTHKQVGPFWCWFQGGCILFVYILEPCLSLQHTLLWGWEFLPLLQPPQIFTVRGFEVLITCAGTLGCMVCLTPQLFLLVYPHANVGTMRFPRRHITVSPLCSSCTSLPLLLVWMNVSSLTRWLLDFHVVQFPGSSGYFLFLNLCGLSFGCARRQSVSTYASILAGSLKLYFLCRLKNQEIKPK